MGIWTEWKFLYFNSRGGGALSPLTVLWAFPHSCWGWLILVSFRLSCNVHRWCPGLLPHHGLLILTSGLFWACFQHLHPSTELKTAAFSHLLEWVYVTGEAPCGISQASLTAWFFSPSYAVSDVILCQMHNFCESVSATTGYPLWT